MVLLSAIFVIGVIHNQIHNCLASIDDQFTVQLAFLTEKYMQMENELKLVKEENSVLRKQIEVITKDNVEIKAELKYVRVEMESSHSVKNDKHKIDASDNLNQNVIFKSTKESEAVPTTESGHNSTKSFRAPFGVIHKENGEIIIEHKRLLLDTVTPSPSTMSKVAFNAMLTHQLLLGQQQIVEYDKVITNVGNGYDSRHGHFTAPVKGVYLIACSIMNVSGGDVYLEMVKNGDRIAHIYGEHDDYSMGTQVTIVVLEKGDMVWIRHQGGTPTETLSNDEYNTFSGTILFEI